MTNRELLGHKIRDKRANRELRDVALEIGITEATLIRVEQGQVTHQTTFVKICRWLQGGDEPATVSVKWFEIRDGLRCIPSLAVLLTPADVLGRALLARAEIGDTAVMLYHLQHGVGHHDPSAWGDPVLVIAHEHVTTHFATLLSGAVIDVEYLRGDREAPRPSELISPSS